MSPATHALTGWVLANAVARNRRDRALITLACVVPDIDGLGFIPEWLTRGSAHPLTWFSEYHHTLHTLLFAVVVGVVCTVFARRHVVTGLAAVAAVHVHFIEDIAGSRGPDGYAWPIPYFSPFSSKTFSWAGQWGLTAWPNVALTLLLVAVTVWIALRFGRSPVEIFSPEADARVVAVMRARVTN